MLSKVGILILIDKYISKKYLIMSSDIRMIPEKLIHVKQDVVKIHCVGTMTSVAIDLVYLSDHRALCLAIRLVELFGLEILLRSDHRIFRI